MKAAELLATLGRLDLSVAVEGDKLRVTGSRSAMTPDLERTIREQRAELVELIAAGWPQESLDAEHRLGGWHARLYAFIGKTVSTPRGAGRLVQVFPERASVILPGEAQVGVFLPQEIGPVGTQQAFGQSCGGGKGH
jgi:hypothetical protein